MHCRLGGRAWRRAPRPARCAPARGSGGCRCRSGPSPRVRRCDQLGIAVAEVVGAAVEVHVDQPLAGHVAEEVALAAVDHEIDAGVAARSGSCPGSRTRSERREEVRLGLVREEVVARTRLGASRAERTISPSSRANLWSGLVLLPGPGRHRTRRKAAASAAARRSRRRGRAAWRRRRSASAASRSASARAQPGDDVDRASRMELHAEVRTAAECLRGVGWCGRARWRRAACTKRS